MSQRDSGYARMADDRYETPAWVTKSLIPHIPLGTRIWEPAAGSGKMVYELRRNGYDTRGTDVATGTDFLNATCDWLANAIITNPPYFLAQEFIKHALKLMKEPSGIVAMLLRTDFDHAKTRKPIFGEHRAFAKKLVLTKRIRWIEGSKGSPSFNHAWFIWDWKHEGPPTLAYH